MSSKVDKIIEELEKEKKERELRKGSKRDVGKMHPHIEESRKHWNYDVGMDADDNLLD
jgi:hypothetical protein